MKEYNKNNMGKTATCIKMLQIMSSGRLFHISELAELCETNPRNIIEYKKELEEIGYWIETVPGRYGGIRLIPTELLPTLKLTIGDKAAISDAYNYVLSKKDFVNKDGYIKTMGKVFSALLIEDPSDSVKSFDKINSAIPESLISKNYEQIAKAISKKQVILIKYKWLKEPTSVVTVHPYKLFLYDNEWRFIGWVVEKGDVVYMKLSRVDSITDTDKTFRVWQGFKFEDYIKNGVFTQNGTMFTLKLKASSVRAKLFKEKKFGANQVIEDIDDDNVLVTMDMQINPSTYNFILGCGDLVEVIEPQWLKDKIKELSKKIYEKY